MEFINCMEWIDDVMVLYVSSNNMLGRFLDVHFLEVRCSQDSQKLKWEGVSNKRHNLKPTDWIQTLEIYISTISL